MTENEILKDLQNYQGILKAKTRINAGVNPEIALSAITEAIDVIQSYRAIGTVEEVKALKGKNEPKMMDGYYCPICRHYFEVGELHLFCPCCGQKLDWGNE